MWAVVLVSGSAGDVGAIGKGPCPMSLETSTHQTNSVPMTNATGLTLDRPTTAEIGERILQILNGKDPADTVEGILNLVNEEGHYAHKHEISRSVWKLAERGLVVVQSGRIRACHNDTSTQHGANFSQRAMKSTHSFHFNPDSNGGEALILTTNLEEQTQELTLMSYSNASTFSTDFVFTPENLRKCANHLELAMMKHPNSEFLQCDYRFSFDPCNVQLRSRPCEGRQEIAIRSQGNSLSFTIGFFFSPEAMRQCANELESAYNQYAVSGRKGDISIPVS